jgi:acyl-CoA thioesterase FadM
VLFHELLEYWFNRRLGLDYADFVSKELRGLPNVHIDCDFRIPSKIGDTVEMRLAVTRIGNSSLTLYVSVHAGNELREAGPRPHLARGRHRAADTANLRKRFARFVAGQPAAGIARREAAR